MKASIFILSFFVLVGCSHPVNIEDEKNVIEYLQGTWEIHEQSLEIDGLYDHIKIQFSGNHFKLWYSVTERSTFDGKWDRIESEGRFSLGSIKSFGMNTDYRSIIPDEVSLANVAIFKNINIEQGGLKWVLILFDRIDHNTFVVKNDNVIEETTVTNSEEVSEEVVETEPASTDTTVEVPRDSLIQ